MSSARAHQVSQRVSPRWSKPSFRLMLHSHRPSPKPQWMVFNK